MSLGINFIAWRNAAHVSGWIADYSDLYDYGMLNNNNNNNNIKCQDLRLNKKTRGCLTKIMSCHYLTGSSL